MQIKTEKIDGANATITATISKETIETNLIKIAKDLAKTAKIDGFRKGKVPVSAVKKQYGEKLDQDAEAEALRDVLEQGLRLKSTFPHFSTSPTVPSLTLTHCSQYSPSI